MAKRLVIVSGKGGVGKSTVAAALALVGAGRGLRTIVAEIAGRDDVARLLDAGVPVPLKETTVSPLLYHMTIERQATLEEYLREEVPGPFPATILARSRGFQTFVNAAPGMQELLTIGKAWELAQRPRRRKQLQPYDLVVLDGPSTGQLLGLLKAPRTFGSIARVGPVARQAAAIERLLVDGQHTGVVIVTTPEQMSVTEALELRSSLAAFEVSVTAVVVNRAFPSRFTAADIAALSPLHDAPPARSARWWYGRTRAQQNQIARLRRGADAVPRVTLPFLFAETFDRECLERLAEILGRELA